METWGRPVSRAATIPCSRQSEARSWSDLNGDDIAQDIEIGPSPNRLFGVPSDASPRPHIQRGFNTELTARSAPARAWSLVSAPGIAALA